ncbi:MULTISPECIES: hypothetical protein [unclassified Streptomyces]|uniref:hypothetical protein n=1 Tax=unclassified Streptomyces TaxID=2593676 RepID=UPI0022538A09|nr:MULTISPECIES: hypothetical protein [unclassified Streptomyces]MCX4989928.1 hypothetical protein [Streptomyces sp. NBC_00568]MCX5004850.1 hypothetical protein [Streptomyces sp. NBC_00638]
MSDVTGGADAYVVRFGWTVKNALLVMFCTGVAGLVLYLGDLTLPIVLCVAFFVLCGVGLTAMSLSRKVALRIDAEGVTLGGSPLVRYEAGIVFVPWDEIVALVRWEQNIRPGGWKVPGQLSLRIKAPYLGIKRRRGLAPMPDSEKPWSTVNEIAAQVTAQQAPTGIAFTSRPVNAWRLKERELVAALEQYGPPGVELKDLRGGPLSGW